MGKFDGILIASDWDGTLCRETDIPENNLKFAKYFMDNGGKFTICSGRHHSYISNFKHLICPNTYLVSFNGACIIDPKNNDLLYEEFISPAVTDIVDELYIKRGLYDTLNVMLKDKEHAIVLTKEEYINTRSTLSQEKIYKILLVSQNEENVIMGCDYVNSLKDPRFTAFRSWLYSTEIVNPKNTKGEALRRLSKKIGAKKTVAIGDFENDISMLEAADISYAVANAHDTVKAAADKITVHQMDGALEAVVRDLELHLS